MLCKFRDISITTEVHRVIYTSSHLMPIPQFISFILEQVFAYTFYESRERFSLRFGKWYLKERGIGYVLLWRIKVVACIKVESIYLFCLVLIHIRECLALTYNPDTLLEVKTSCRYRVNYKHFWRYFYGLYKNMALFIVLRVSI